MESINLLSISVSDINFGLLEKDSKDFAHLFQNHEKPLLTPRPLFEQTKKHESYWLKQLENSKPSISLPFDIKENNVTSKNHVQIAYKKFSSSKYTKLEILTTTLIYFCKINNYNPYTIAYSNNYLATLHPKLKPLLHEHVPLTLELDSNIDFVTAAMKISKQISELDNYKTYTKDITNHYPTLQNKESSINTLSVNLVKSINDYQPENPSNIAIVITKNLGFYIYGDKQSLAKNNLLKTTVNNIILHLENLLINAINNKDQPIRSFFLLTKNEYQKIVVDWNSTEKPYPTDKTLHELFEEQAGKTPNNIAVMFNKQSLTYQELNNRSNQLAHYLKTLKVKPDTLIAISIERSLEMIIGILGILKAGAAYLPIDPNYPTARIEHILKDSAAPIILTDHRLQPKILSQKETTVISLAKKLKEIKNTPKNNLIQTTTSNNLAYAIYTSGTTGKPKGVLIEHKSAVNMALFHIDKLKITSKSTMLQLVSSSFDVMVAEFTTALLSGARLYVAPKNKLTVGPELINTINTNKITAGFFPNAILRALPANETPSLSTIVSGGEECPQSIVNKWYKKDRIFINAYGPTEATVCTTMSECSPKQNSPNIGKPCTNTKAYILDKHLQPVPIGIIGELYIGGTGLARGYLNRIELNQEKFLPNPLDKGNSTLYKTGDLVRWLPDGNIEFIGRTDDQVKIRGFRIELNEINSWLQKHPEIKESIVLVKKNEKNNGNIIAYLTCRNKNHFNLDECKDYLRKLLPDYMIPSSLVILNSLPLNSSGKIDKKALLALDVETTTRSTPYKPATTLNEKGLVKIWSKILDLKPDQISIQDGFLEIGGDSLSSARTISEINSYFKTNLTINDLFKHRTIENLAKNIKSTDQKNSYQSIKPALKQNYYPLSYPQELIWLHQQVAPNIPFYNESIIIDIKDNIKISALKRSINELVKRHEILRTNIILKDNQPRQIINPHRPLKIPYFNLTTLAKNKKQKLALTINTKQLKKIFNLEKGPLLRCTLIKLEKEHYQLSIAAHHIIFDGISVTEVLLKELKTLYKDFSQNNPSSLNQLTLQYKDYSVWQKNKDLNPKITNSLKYWRKKLADLKPLQLPTKQPRSKNISFRGKRQHLTLPQEFSQQLEKVSKEENVTLFMTLFAAFNILLYRYTNQDDIAIGTAAAGRNNAAIENMMGDFLNTIILRNKISDKLTFKQLLQKIKNTCTEAYFHQDLPFQELLKNIKLSRENGEHQVFQIAFIFESNAKTTDTTWSFRQSAVDSGTAKFELLFGIEQRPQGIMGFVEYNADLYDNLFIKNLITNFQNLLQNIGKNPDFLINQIPIPSPKELNKVLINWNKTKRKYPTETIHELFERQIEKNRDNLAVSLNNESLTYGELNTKANQLANHLRKLGATSETLVAVCLNRSIDTIISILGILKAGCAYIPIDPDYPKTRIESILKDGNASTLITNQTVQSNLQLTGVKTLTNTIFIDKNWKKIANSSTSNPPNISTQDNLAYVIYTSGSTGKPKGTLLPHKTITNLINWQTTNDEFKKERQNVALFASFGFDVSLQETFYTLLNGHKLHIISEEIKKSITKLIGFLQNKKINKLFLPPSILGLLTNEAITYNTSLPHLNEIIVASEALIINEDIQKFFADNKNIRLTNHYGPSETHVATSYTLPPDASTWCLLPSIGKPIANTKTYILDKNMQPTPIGVPGEIYLGGDGLAKCYLNRPKLNQSKFTLNPFSKNKNEKIYKTGDLAKWLSDGSIAFIDRIDNQVKIRGFRIELDEIDHCILQHKSVHQCVVVADTDQYGTKKLVAYIVFKNKNEQNINNIRHYLKMKLPDYMIPAAFVTLDKLPLNNNGKINKKVLPKPSFGNKKEKLTSPPKTVDEKLMANIWAKVLKLNIKRISITDSFFELGGHSLSSLKLLTEIKKTFSVDLEPHELFNTSTISNLLMVINKKKSLIKKGSTKNSHLPSNVILLKKGKNNVKPIFLIHPVGGTVFWYKSLVKYLNCDHSIYGIQDPSINTDDKLFNNIKEISQFYLSQIKKIQPKGPYLLGGASFGGTVAIEIAQQLKLLGDKTDHIMLFDSWAIYPDNVKKKKIFENGMRKIHENLIEKSAAQELTNIKSWLDLQWHRARILWDYHIPTSIQEKITLFKAKEPLQFFKFREHESNYWADYTNKKIEVYLTPGDHETMFHQPNIKSLACLVNQVF